MTTWTISCDYCCKTVERDCEPADVTDFFHQSIWPGARKITAVCCDCMADIYKEMSNELD